jgi:tRNA modification GTPase
MRTSSPSDTIAAIATASGEAGIGIVRVSGARALAIAASVFQAKSGIAPERIKTFTVHFGHIKDAQGALLDEALLTVMRAPKTYTREDVIELSCHGGIIPLRRALERCLEAGCRLAEPGEFTRRAFLNGRLDLAQAEAVLDVIRAKSDAAMRQGSSRLQGSLSRQVRAVREGLISVLADLEAQIDFPEEADVPKAVAAALRDRLEASRQALAELLAGAKCGRALKEGIHCVICGKPNVGKSSLLNALLRRERSIVTAVAGTTRDTVEEIVDIKGIPVRLVDTAGILKPRDLIEKKAVSRSRQHIRQAEVILLVIDASKKLTPADLALMRQLSRRQVICVANKCDLPQKTDKELLAKRFPRVVFISAKKGRHLSALEDSIAALVFGGEVAPASQGLVASTRHIHLLHKAQKLVAGALDSLDNSLSPEFPAQDIKEALDSLDELLGARFSEDLLDKIFSQFCIGK